MTTRFFVVFFMLSVLLNAAQATESLQKRSRTQLQEQFQKKSQTANNLQPVYSLSRLYQLAREFDKNIRMAEYEAQAAGHALNKEHGALLPQVDIYASSQRYAVQEPGQEDDNYTGTNYQLRVIQPLFRVQLLHNKALAKIDVQVQQLDYAIALQQLAVQLASAYFSILKQENLLISLQAEESALYQQLSGAQLEFSAGTLSAVDLADIEAQYRSLQAQRIAQHNTLSGFYDSLGVMIGQQINQLPYPEADDIQLEPLALQQNPEQFLQTVAQHNLQLATAKLKVATQQARLQRAQSAHYPELQLEASHQVSETNGNQSLTSAATLSRVNTLALNFSLPVYRGGSSSAEVDQQQALLRKAQAEWEQTKLNVEESAKNSFRNHKSLQDTIIANKRWVDAAKKSLQATQAGLASGIRNQTDLLYAQSRLFTAQRNYNAAQYDLMMNAIELSSLSGMLNTEFLTLLDSVIKLP